MVLFQYLMIIIDRNKIIVSQKVLFLIVNKFSNLEMMIRVFCSYHMQEKKIKWWKTENKKDL